MIISNIQGGLDESSPYKKMRKAPTKDGTGLSFRKMRGFV